MANETVLAITVIGVPPYSARGLAESITPIEGSAVLDRDINGRMVDLSLPEFQLLRVSISGSNQHQPPAVAGIWGGQECTIDCISELAYPTAGGIPAEWNTGNGKGRAIVSGSSKVEGSFTIFRPQLRVALTSWTIDRDEYNAAIGWTMTFEEIGPD